MTTFPDAKPGLERAEHPRAATLPRELRPAVHEQPAANPTPAGPQPAEPSTLPMSAGAIEKIGGPATGAPGLAPNPSKT